MSLPSWSVIPACTLALATTASAQDSVVIYRCTDASGAVTVQNDVRCPAGSRQERRVIETATPPQAPVPTPAPVMPLASAEPPLAPMPIESPPAEVLADAPVPLAERGPPPPLFACKTWDREEYLSDDPIPAERCAPMRTTGLDGDPAQGAGAACMMVTDACQPVPVASLCERWHHHLMRSEAIVEFGRARDPHAAAAELQRIRGIVRHNACD